MQLGFHIVDEQGGFRVEEREVAASGVVKIGRLQSAHLHLADATVSRMHAVLEVGEETVTLIDLGSASGTLVNGKKINKVQLDHWDEVQLGTVRFFVAIGGRPPGTAEAPPPSAAARPADATVATLSHRVSQTAISPIAQLPDGVGAVRGRVRALQPLTSPVTGIPVVGYQVKVDLHDGGPQAYLARINDFTVEDDGGKALVQVQGCRLVLEQQYMLSSADAGSVAVDVIKALRQGGKPLPDGLQGTFSWEEYYLEPGEQVYVCGQASTVLSAAGYRDLNVQRQIASPDDGAFVISDLEPEELAVLLASGA
jgi:pSer/pThr/pTyr-binding forkhead associated (FHA) protein